MPIPALNLEIIKPVVRFGSKGCKAVDAVAHLAITALSNPHPMLPIAKGLAKRAKRWIEPFDLLLTAKKVIEARPQNKEEASELLINVACAFNSASSLLGQLTKVLTPLSIAIVAASTLLGGYRTLRARALYQTLQDRDSFIASQNHPGLHKEIKKAFETEAITPALVEQFKAIQSGSVTAGELSVLAGALGVIGLSLLATTVTPLAPAAILATSATMQLGLLTYEERWLKVNIPTRQ